MKNTTFALSAMLLLGACSAPGPSQSSRQTELQLSEALIDAFYSFDKARLKSMVYSAPDSSAKIVYYQGWAEGGNYKIVKREPCGQAASGAVSCAITVQDDPMLALGIDFNVTDTFHITFTNNAITAVDTSSNDLQVYHDAGAWVFKNMPELIEQPCQGFFDGGPTPADCARAMTKGYARFAASKDFPN